METDAIVEMRSLLIGAPTDGPGAGFAADDCCLFLWAIRPMLPQALEVGSAWGFEYKTVAFTWVKTGKTDSEKRPIGLGYWTRANPEYCLLFTRGNPQRRVGATGVRELIETGDEPDTIWDPRREHSRKPDAIYSGIEALVEGPYVELFARQSWPGWDCWGDETGKFDDDAAM